MSEGSPELDVVVWGASGFTGKLTAEYLLAQYGAGNDLRWGLGGRSRARRSALDRRRSPNSTLPTAERCGKRA